MPIPIALTIAGSDPSGGAGIQADLKTFHQHGVFGTAVITLLTVQNTEEVRAVEVMAAGLVRDQLNAVLSDLPPRAAKTGALGNSAVIEAVAALAARFAFPLVVDPVMMSKHGAVLLPGEAVEALRNSLLPHAFLVTPNILEARELAGIDINNEQEMIEAGKRIRELGPKNVLVKGGHGEGETAVDILVTEQGVAGFEAPRIDTRHTHGTGCTLSAAITANLANGFEIDEAVARAKQFVANAIRTNPGLGRGCGPVNFFADVKS